MHLGQKSTRQWATVDLSFLTKENFCLFFGDDNCVSDAQYVEREVSDSGWGSVQCMYLSGKLLRFTAGSDLMLFVSILCVTKRRRACFNLGTVHCFRERGHLHALCWSLD